MKTRNSVFAAIMVTAGLFSFNAYSMETPGENFVLDGLDAAQLRAQRDPAARFPGASAIPFSPEGKGRDLTGDFNLIWSGAGLMPGEREIAELRKCKVLLVRGFMTGGYVTSTNFLGMRMGAYFQDQMKVLKAIGVDYEISDIDSVMSPAHNAAKVAREIEASDKPVIIISHSDGGMYVIEALMKNRGLLSKVRGFISLQTPFRGSPVADYVRENSILMGFMSKLLRHFGGTVDSLFSLGSEERNRFQDSNQAAIREIIAKVKIISFASWKAEEKHKMDTMLEIPRDFMLKSGIASDGLVPVESAILPGSDYVAIFGIDHIVSVMNNDSVLKCDRARLTRTLLLMILSK